ncbi:HNH endonuclease [Mangrovihabitans endophyticus]|uniref:HNH endonuclease n=1 Tax=Mangrovihabitans endophyticus TaxID=1751298 RepID=A0A8J3BXK2_9ACTN|nr:hypothetical protein [Mangrovihabitans endophyticus]GGK89332.1 hypothetical protein GCM10012284_24140 [Mangrovihabitans endophyticus]
MPYFLETDAFADLPVWEVLADGAGDVVDALQAAYTRMKSKASHLLSEGYLTAGLALQLCRGRRRVLDKLCTPVLGEQPLLHRPGDECECLGDTWTDGYAYRIHAFLKRNPTRREYNRSRAQKADLRDARLKGLVYRRDGGCCRYCRSGPLSPKAGRAKDRRKVLQYDHVDPDRPAGVEGENFVVACGRCNESKGKRTPYEADMVLLDMPEPDEASALERRELLLLDMPDHSATTDRPPTDQRPNSDHEQKPITDTVTDPIADRKHDPNADPAPPVRPSPTTPQPDHRSDQRLEPSGMGRGGTPDPASPPAGRHGLQEPRTGEHPDPYHRRSRRPPNPPAYISAEPQWPPVWPAGSVPATTPEERP